MTSCGIQRGRRGSGQAAQLVSRDVPLEAEQKFFDVDPSREVTIGGQRGLYWCMTLRGASSLPDSCTRPSLTAVSSRASFQNLSRWLADARALASPQLVTVLVGNKSDREEDREVEWAEASQWAAENGTCASSRTRPYVHAVIHNPDVHFLEASSLTGDNIEAPFLLCARSILLAIESGQLDPDKAGSGVSYGDRALRRVNSSGRLSFGSLSHARRKSTVKLGLSGITRRCC